MNPIILNVLAAAGTGFGKSLLGYVAVIRKEDFDGWKFFQGALIGIVGGAIAGVIADDWKMSIIGALGADDIRSFAINYVRNK